MSCRLHLPAKQKPGILVRKTGLGEWIHRNKEKLVDRYVSGARDRHSIKAAYLIRDTIKVIGTDKIKPAAFAIFYDDPDNPGKGGTGHTMNVCEQNNIPMIDQKT